VLVEREDVEVNSKDDDSQTPLFRAAQRGHEAVVKELLKQEDVEADAKDKFS
jgi:ankyrin repeat protein